MAGWQLQESEREKMDVMCSILLYEQGVCQVNFGGPAFEQ